MRHLRLCCLLSCAIIAAPALGAGLVFAPASLDFGGESMATQSPVRSMSVTNTDAIAHDVSGVAPSSADFLVSHDCGTLAPSQSCTVSVSFAPQPRPGDLGSETAIAGNVTMAFDGSGQAVAALSGVAEKSFVTHYYRSILRRAPDAPGKQFWTWQALRMDHSNVGANEAWFAMAAYFFTSGEYLGLNRDDPGFVTDLYATFFSRAADGPGMSYWVGQLQSGLPREIALASFMFSPEFDALSKSVFGTSAARPEANVVMDFYRGMLARLPDTSGYTFWWNKYLAVQCTSPTRAQVLGVASSVADAFAAEHQSRNRSDAQFVGDLYNAFLRRGGDLQGAQFWIGQLSGGQRTRAQLRADFIASAEFAARADAVAARPCLSFGASGTIARDPAFVSIAIGGDGRPVVGLGNNTSPSQASVLHCGNDTCSAGNSEQLLATATSTTAGVGLAVGSDGLPFLTYSANHISREVKCGTADCSAGNVESPYVGEVALGAGPNGNPVLWGNSAFIQCGNLACTAGNVTTPFNYSLPRQGMVRLGDGTLAVALGGSAPYPTQLAKCDDVACATSHAVTLDNSTGLREFSLAATPLGSAVLAYPTNEELRVAWCDDVNCTSTGNTKPIPYEGTRTLGMAIPADGRPVIVVSNLQTSLIRIVKCGDYTCTHGNHVTTLPTQAVEPLAVLIRSNGLPLIKMGFGFQTTLLACDRADCSGN